MRRRSPPEPSGGVEDEDEADAGQDGVWNLNLVKLGELFLLQCVLDRLRPAAGLQLVVCSHTAIR